MSKQSDVAAAGKADEVKVSIFQFFFFSHASTAARWFYE
jgi:hypothetical protein